MNPLQMGKAIEIGLQIKVKQYATINNQKNWPMSTMTLAVSFNVDFNVDFLLVPVGFFFLLHFGTLFDAICSPRQQLRTEGKIGIFCIRAFYFDFRMGYLRKSNGSSHDYCVIVLSRKSHHHPNSDTN